MVHALPERLRQRDTPVTVGVIGAGEFGTKCINQVQRTTGLELRGVADPAHDRIVAACDEAGIPERQTEIVGDTEDVESVITDETCVLLTDGTRLAAAGLDVVVEATGNPNAGARHAYKALVNGTHVVMATVEADATVGPVLADIAESRDVVYTTAYGDQPALIAELVGWARTSGMDVVAAGRGISSYDANAAIELCAAANATGLPPDTDGLHVPEVSFAEAPDRLRPRDVGGVLAESGVVDGIVSPPDEQRVPGESIADGVFVVVTTPNDDALEFFRIKNRSGAYVSSDGEYVTFFRPHHLPGAETPVSIARAGVLGSHTGTPSRHVADVIAVADEPIPAGTTIEIDYPKTDAAITSDVARVDSESEERPVPFALLDGSTVVRDIESGSTITYGDIDPLPSFLYRLRSIMDSN